MNTHVNGQTHGLEGAVVMAAPMGQAAHAAGFTEAPASVNVRVSYRGFDVQLTLRDRDGRAVLSRLDTALAWLEAQGAQPTARPAERATAAHSGTSEGAAPDCPTHGRPMKPGQRGGWFCPAKIADDDGTGKPVYCRHKVGA